MHRVYMNSTAPERPGPLIGPMSSLTVARRFWYSYRVLDVQSGGEQLEAAQKQPPLRSPHLTLNFLYFQHPCRGFLSSNNVLVIRVVKRIDKVLVGSHFHSQRIKTVSIANRHSVRKSSSLECVELLGNRLDIVKEVESVDADNDLEVDHGVTESAARQR